MKPGRTLKEIEALSMAANRLVCTVAALVMQQSIVTIHRMGRKPKEMSTGVYLNCNNAMIELVADYEQVLFSKTRIARLHS